LPSAGWKRPRRSFLRVLFRRSPLISFGHPPFAVPLPRRARRVLCPFSTHQPLLSGIFFFPLTAVSARQLRLATVPRFTPPTESRDYAKTSNGSLAFASPFPSRTCGFWSNPVPPIETLWKLIPPQRVAIRSTKYKVIERNHPSMPLTSCNRKKSLYNIGTKLPPHVMFFFLLFPSALCCWYHTPSSLCGIVIAPLPLPYQTVLLSASPFFPSHSRGTACFRDRSPPFFPPFSSFYDLEHTKREVFFPGPNQNGLQCRGPFFPTRRSLSRLSPPPPLSTRVFPDMACVASSFLCSLPVRTLFTKRLVFPPPVDKPFSYAKSPSPPVVHRGCGTPPGLAELTRSACLFP